MLLTRSFKIFCNNVIQRKQKKSNFLFKLLQFPVDLSLHNFSWLLFLIFQSIGTSRKNIAPNCSLYYDWELGFQMLYKMNFNSFKVNILFSTSNIKGSNDLKWVIKMTCQSQTRLQKDVENSLSPFYNHIVYVTLKSKCVTKGTRSTLPIFIIS